MNKQINLIINGKGGVGKSFFATNFVQYLKDCGVAHCAIDSDHENSTLKRFHPQSEFINLEHRREIAETAPRQQSRRIDPIRIGNASLAEQNLRPINVRPNPRYADSFIGSAHLPRRQAYSNLLE
jgi:CO dehydrogenase nickel-insertion accessory protein CooC1